MEYEHIQDCWNALYDCKTYGQVVETIENFPQWSGNWNISYGSGAEFITITNSYYDEEFEDYMEDEVDLDVISPDIILEKSELEKIDPVSKDIEVSKDVFDDFIPDNYIKIYFTDAEDVVYKYIMKYENENVIGMQFEGEAEIGD